MVSTKQSEQLAARVNELRDMLRKASVQDIARRSGADFVRRERGSTLDLYLMGLPVRVTFPDLLVCDPQSGESLPVATQALLLYYLVTADGAPLDGRWISFAELPDGRFYNQAFQGYTGMEIARKFGNDLGAFEAVAKEIGGQKIYYGDAAFAFQALPRVMLAIVYHQGDEDFPAACQILFDASTSHYLPIDVSAILGSMLTRAVVRAAFIEHP